MVTLTRDSLGPVPVPDPPLISPFPLHPDFGIGIDYVPPIVTHTFDQPGLKTEQRFLLAPMGARRFKFAKHHLSCREYDDLKAHFEIAQGAYAEFPYTVYEPGGNTETVLARYENPNISFDHAVSLIVNGPGISFLEVPQNTPSYSSVNRVTRFPDAVLRTALESQFQEIIPLITIIPRNDAGAAVSVSNQRFSLDGQLYLPRLLDWSGISQSLGENADSASWNFGNADGIWQTYVNQVNLYAATIQFSLYHLGCQYIVDMWKGSATSWGFDTSGRFQINASDGVFYLSLAYPSRRILRTCWKVYKGRWCPSTSSFPDCPKSYDACIARGVPHSFGGFIVPPQSIRIKDNSTGIWGFGRSSMTSVTVTQDTVYQRPLQECYTDEQMIVNCDLAAARDEGDFYAGIGIVGEGPISSFDANLIHQSLDGQPPHDPLHGGGFRGVIGTDPSGANDFVGIDQAPFDQIPAGSTFSGGVAFAEIRRTDAKGLQLTAVTDHQMSVSIIGGIGGWIWDGPGQRRWLPALHNSVWVAINVYLRGLGLRVDESNQDQVPSDVMEQYFDVEAAIEAAAICDTVVPKIIGDGQELQFPFRGALKEQKPLRDWLREILNCCLGYYTFVNGKLWIGIRVNSSTLAGNAFTRATILFKSLVAAPLQPQFNWLVGNFGDEEFGWQLNNVTIYDIDHAGFLGTPDSPQYLTNSMSFVGVSNKSQCARIITTRLREEIGGLKDGRGPHGTGSGIDEQANARNFQFKSTVLALRTMVGDIVSITHDSMPGGYAEGRVSKWTLNPDFSIDIQATCTTEDMYDLVVGPKPEDILPPPVPPELLESPAGLAWMPNELAPFPDDPVYPPWERTFDLWQEYEITRDGVWQPTLNVKGQMTINRFATNTQPRIVEIEFVNGGNLNGPLTVYAAVTQNDDSGQPSFPSNLTGIWIPAGVTNQQINLTVIPAPDATLTSYDVWAGLDRRRIALQFSGSGDPPQTISIPGPIHDMTEGLPEGNAWGVKIAGKHVWHAGIAGLLVHGVTAPNQIQCFDFLNSTDNWIGQVAFVCANIAGEVPLWNFIITAFDPATATLTVSPDCVRATPEESVQAGDVLIVYAFPSAATKNSITNSMWDNSVNRQQFPGTTGMHPGEETGRIIRILRGTGANQWRFVTDNDNLTHWVSPDWDVIPDSSSIYIVEAPSWPDFSETSQLIAPRLGVSAQMTMEVPNLTEEVVLVGGFLLDTDGRATDDSVAVYRMIYVFGQPPTVRVVGPDGGPWDLAITDQIIRSDTSANDVVIVLLPLALYQGRGVLFFNEGPYATIIQTTAPDTFPDGSTQVSITAAAGTLRITAGGIFTT